MTFSHDDIRDRLVDYLYGQLDGEVRAAFQAHLEGCTACREEVSGAARARVVGREVVRRPLADPVPEHVRVRAFEAARAAVAARAVAPGQLKATAVATAPASGEGWFSRLRRRWTFPTFATVAAMAIFVLVRATIFREAKSPVSADRVHELAKPPAEPVPALAPAPVAAPTSAPVEAVQRKAKEAPQKPAASRRLHHSSSLDELSSFGAAPAVGGGAAQPAPSAPRIRTGLAKKTALPEPELDGRFEAEEGQARARSQEPQDKSFADRSRPAPEASASAGASEGEMQKEARQPVVASPKREYAAPPPPPAPAPPAAFAPSAQAKGSAAERDDSAQANTAPVAARKHEKKDKDEATAGAAPSGPRSGGLDPAAARGMRAEGLMNERRWSEAIAILSNLLRRYPTHPAAPRWRKLLDAAQTGLHAPDELFATPPPPR